jgi:hypothetical protein
MKIKEETTSSVAVNATGPGIENINPLMAIVQREKQKHPLEILLDRVKTMKKDLTGKNPNPLNNTFSNGNSELKKNSSEAIRNSMDREREKHSAKKLRDITKGK